MRLAQMVKMRERLLQDQRELVAFHVLLVHDSGEWDSENMAELVRGLSARVRSLLLQSMEAEGTGCIATALDNLAVQLNSEELASIHASGRRLRQFLGTKALKKYEAKLRKAKAEVYTDTCEVYETACLDPIVAPAIVTPAVSSRARGAAS